MMRVIELVLALMRWCKVVRAHLGYSAGILKFSSQEQGKHEAQACARAYAEALAELGHDGACEPFPLDDQARFIRGQLSGQIVAEGPPAKGGTL